jgi:prevent-host-death family protein
VTPINVGIREAKANLSRLLKEAQKGAIITITDRGEAIARLVPIAEKHLPLDQRITNMEKNGWLEPLTNQDRKLPAPQPVTDELAQKFLQEDRG